MKRRALPRQTVTVTGGYDVHVTSVLGEVLRPQDADATATAPCPVGLPLLVLEEIIEALPGVLFYAKDMQGRFISGNNALRKFYGAQTRDDFIGKQASLFLSHRDWDKHELHERKTLMLLRSLAPQLGPTSNKRGDVLWVVWMRWPLVARAGCASGSVGIGRVLDASSLGVRRVYEAVRLMRDTLHGTLSIAALSTSMGVSHCQLKRDFQRVLGVCPQSFWSRLRMEQAIELLHGEMPIVNVAMACGYSDQTSFSRRFRQYWGTSPGTFQQKVLSARKNLVLGATPSSKRV